MGYGTLIIKKAIGLPTAGLARPWYPSCHRQTGGFLPRHSTRWHSRNKPKRTGKNRRALRAPPLPLLSPKALLYYQFMDAGVLIPIAFLLAGSVAIILSVYMVR